MSVMARRGSHTGTLALVAGGGVLAWLVLRGGRGFGLGGGGGADDGSAGSLPPCRLRLDEKTLTLDGRVVSRDEAVATCRAARSAEVLVTGDAIAGVADQLLAALRAAGVSIGIVTPAQGKVPGAPH